MLKFLEMDGYILVTPSEEDAPQVMQAVETGNRLNDPFLDGLVSPPKGGRLTGSFIYSHPPDYVGRPTMTWGTSEWRHLFRELKDTGIDTVIYQASAWAEIRECYYPSRLFAGFKQWNSLDALVEAAGKEKMTFFLGGMGNLYGFDEKATSVQMENDRDEQLACYDELVDLYRGGFQGFYMSPETGYPGERQPEREDLLNRYFRAVCQGVKQRTPDLPILLSPGTYYYENREEEIHDFLYRLFHGVPVDIMCPQDSIGAYGNSLPHLKPSFTIWKNLSNELGFSLWVNVESFQRVTCGTSQDFVSADFRRLAVQLSHASQVGEKIVSWELPYFFSAMAGERGIALRQAYMRSLAAGERDQV